MAAPTADKSIVVEGEAKAKIRGRAFYESIGSPKYIVAPMVDQSEFAWRMLTRSFMSPEEQSSLLAYTPMLHARLYAQEEKYRRSHFQAVKPRPDSNTLATGEADQEPGQELWLDGNPTIDRPLFVQFCANDPDHLLEAAKKVAPYCDAVDLNLGCPQGIARKGHYGAFLQEDQDLIFRLVNTLHRGLDVPVTAKIRILDTDEATLAYARNVLRAGASVLTVHGRRRDQKGHHTGTADWRVLRYLRENLPPDTVLFANGNVLQGGDVARCLEATGADGVMSAEGNLSDPAIFARPPAVGEEGREYWRGRDGKGGYRVDAVTRRYLDIIHRYALGQDPPVRKPLFMPGDDEAATTAKEVDREEEEEGQPPRKKQKQQSSSNGGARKGRESSPNIGAMQPHLFHLLRHFVSHHTDVRDMLARAPREGVPAYERVLTAVEERVAEGLREYERTDGASWEAEVAELMSREDGVEGESSVAAQKRCKRPWWVVQPIVRPLPAEAVAKGAIKLNKKEMKKQELGEQQQQKQQQTGEKEVPDTVALHKTEALEVQKDIASRDELVSG